MVDVMERQTWVDNICKGVRDEINKRRNEQKNPWTESYRTETNPLLLIYHFPSYLNIYHHQLYVSHSFLISFNILKIFLMLSIERRNSIFRVVHLYLNRAITSRQWVISKKFFFLHYPKKVSMKTKKIVCTANWILLFFWVEKCCEYISYSDWTIIRGPCMNNIKMRNSSNRDALLLKWWLFDIMSMFCCFLCVWYVKFMGLSGNVSIKHSSQPIPFPQSHFISLQYFIFASPLIYNQLNLLKIIFFGIISFVVH